MSMGSTVSRHPNLFVVSGVELATDEIEQMIASLHREFGLTPKRESFYDKIFFLLKDDREILAFAGLWKVEPFLFDGVGYSVHALVEVVANIKGEGYGKRVVSAMHDYLLAKNLTGFGFCAPKTSEFYKKCGFSVAAGITKRFIYKKNGKNITNQDGQVIFYLDSSDELIAKIMKNSSLDVYIPTQELW